MAPWHRHIPDGKICLLIIGAAALVSVGAACWIVQTLLLRLLELLP
jgi:hypothetical protein